MIYNLFQLFIWKCNNLNHLFTHYLFNQSRLAAYIFLFSYTNKFEPFVYSQPIQPMLVYLAIMPCLSLPTTLNPKLVHLLLSFSTAFFVGEVFSLDLVFPSSFFSTASPLLGVVLLQLSLRH